MHAVIDLEAEHLLTRAAVMKAGVDVTDSIDGLYRDWRRWRDGRSSSAPTNLAQAAYVDQRWVRHLAHRSLIDPPHVAARAERVRKDESAVHTRPHPAQKHQRLKLAAEMPPGFG